MGLFWQRRPGVSAAAGQALGLIRGQVPSVRWLQVFRLLVQMPVFPGETAISVGGHSAQFPLLGLE